MVGIPHKSRPMGSICMSGHVQKNDGFWLLATVKSGKVLWLTFLHCSSSLCLCRNRATFPLRSFVLNKSPIDPALSNSSL
jgi:hypothetical protein